MKPILFVLTGGTIGSTVENSVIRTDSSSCRVLTLYREIYGEDVRFETVQLLNILSENLQKKHWECIANYLFQVNLSAYSGVIIAHGSDTLSYSSAFLGVCLSGLSLPVVLTASDRVPDHPESNAVANLRGAVVLIQNVQKGVYTVYRNPTEKDCSVWLSTRIQEADRVYGCFSSIDGYAWAHIINEKLVQTKNSLPLSLIEKKSPLFSFPCSVQLPYDVLMIQPYPSMDYYSITSGENCRAVLHLTYHSSSASVEGENSALGFLKHCQEKNIPFYLASFPQNHEIMYETSCLLLQNGAIPLTYCTKEAAYAKLLLFINARDTLPENFMNKEIFFETI